MSATRWLSGLIWCSRVASIPQRRSRAVVHHSIELQHRDTNFGALFSIWDRLFGTQYRGHDEYPETGIADAAFPHEAKGDLRSLLVTPLAQMAYPLRRLRAHLQN